MAGNHFTRAQKRARLVVQGASVLVVDDDADLRDLHAAILRLEGYEVRTAANGAEALQRLRAGKFDLVLTDRQMPVMDGESLVLALRSAGMRLPVVMISASLADRPLRERVAREVARVLPKPIPLANVLAAVFLALNYLPSPVSLAA